MFYYVDIFSTQLTNVLVCVHTNFRMNVCFVFFLMQGNCPFGNCIQLFVKNNVKNVIIIDLRNNLNA